MSRKYLFREKHDFWPKAESITNDSTLFLAHEVLQTLTWFLYNMNFSCYVLNTTRAYIFLLKLTYHNETCHSSNVVILWTWSGKKSLPFDCLMNCNFPNFSSRKCLFMRWDETFTHHQIHGPILASVGANFCLHPPSRARPTGEYSCH